MEINLELHDRQIKALSTEATEVLYGGAAGGGKSHLMRSAAIIWAIGIPGLQIYLFRRVREDLIKNHIEGPTGFRSLLAPWLDRFVTIVNDDEIRFNNGSKIYLCHCQHEKDRFKYQGAEIHVLMVDELTHFTEVIYRFLRSRVRMPESMAVPSQFTMPRILCATNPGGIGHQWVKATWIDAAPEMEIWQTPDKEGGFKRQYIPARLSDNPSINQSQYAANLSGLGNDELVRAMLDGDWDVVSGAALSITRESHMLRAFSPPQAWTKFQVMDWGYVRPFSIGWYCVVSGATLLKGRQGYDDIWLPDGAVVRYREWYGSTEKPNEGIRMESPEAAIKMIAMEDEAGERMDYRVADTQIWAKNDGTSTYERMYKATEGRYNPRQSIKDRQASYLEICARLKGDLQEDGSYIPMLYATENCTHFWRTIPTLILDELHPEKGADEKQENHVYDELAYACMSRPYKTTSEQRLERDFFRKRRENNLDQLDPYRQKPMRKK